MIIIPTAMHRELSEPLGMQRSSVTRREIQLREASESIKNQGGRRAAGNRRPGDSCNNPICLLASPMPPVS